MSPRPTYGETLTFQLTLPRDHVEVVRLGEYSAVHVRETVYNKRPEAASTELPCRVVNVLLPQGQRVQSFQLIVGEEVTIETGVDLSPSQEDLSVAGGASRDALSAGEPLSRGRGRYLSTGYLEGRAIASFVVSALRLEEKNLVLAERIELRIETMSDETSAEVVVPERYRDGIDNRVKAMLSNLVVNPEMDERYRFERVRVKEPPGGFAPSSYPSLEGSPVDYVIVTTQDLADEYQVLADWKTAKGVPTVVRTVEWIESNTRNGVDMPETIRFFVQDAYAKWGIRYLLLGGDTDVLPTRYALSRYDPPEGETRIPTDLYFGCLDGSWNTNHDESWGEPVLDNPDFYAEVYHGRLPISNATEVAAMIDRITRYEAAETPAYLDKYVLLAEVLIPQDWQEGQAIGVNGTTFTEPIYQAILDPTSLRITRMYQTENLYPGSVEENKAAVLDSLNAGFNFVFHVGHGFRANLSVGDERIRSPDADALTNDAKWFNLYMLNCTAAAYDYFCLAEHFLRNPDGGAVSVIGASEVVFPFASSPYMIEYNKLVFGQDVVHIGEAFARSRLPRTPFAVGIDDADAWTHFIYAILADPEMPLHTTAIETPVVTHVSSVGLGQSNIAFTVTADGLPVDSAVVCLTKDDDDYETVATNALGQATVNFARESPGAIDVVVTGLNLARHQSAITVTSSTGPYVSISGVAVDDNAVGGTSGNADGQIDAGEVVDLVVSLVNSGGSTALGVSAVLTETHPLVNVLAGTASFGAINTVTPVTSPSPIRVAFGSGIPDETVIELALAISATNGGPWNDRFRKVVHAPRLELTTLFVDDSSGDGDGVVGANEPVTLFYTLKNYGSGAAHGLNATIQDVDNAFAFTDSTDAYPDLAPFVGAQNVSGFDLVEMTTAAEHRVRVVVIDMYNRAYVDTIELRPPLPPSALSFDASLGPDRLEVAWVGSSSTGNVRYNVYRSLVTTGPFARANTDPLDHRMFVNMELSPLTRYYFHATAIDASGNESAPSAVSSASTNPPTLAGFPIFMPWTTTSSPAVGDIDGDGDNEIVVGNEHVYAWHADGLELKDGDLDPRTWGVLNTAGSGFTAAIALAHVDDVPGLDIIAADLNTQSVYCMNYNGTVLPGGPRAGTDGFWAAPVAGDLNGDGKIEVIAVDAKGVVFAWKRNGSEFIDGDGIPATNGVFFVSPATTFHYSTPALSDIDGDSKDEIILGTRGGKVYALNGDGSSVPGWPFTMPGEMVGGVVTGHILGGYYPEIVVRSSTSEVYVLNHDATVRAGWPRSIPYTDAFFRATPALADFDHDGTLEIVLAHHSNSPLGSRVYVVDYQGADLAGWPVTYSTVFSECSPLVVDVDGNNNLDVVMGDEDGLLHGWNSGGGPLDGFPIATKDAIRATPFVWDVDGDGNEDMVVHSWDQNVYVYDFAGAHVAGAGQWPTVHSNAHRNGRAGYVVVSGVAGADFRFSVHEGRLSVEWTLREADGSYDISKATMQEDALTDFVTLARGLSGDAGGVVRYDDGNVEMGRTYVYKLASTDDPADVFATDPIYVPIRRADLRQNYPNPFNPTTRIVYYVPEGGAKPISLLVYDVSGSRVRTLVNGVREPGRFVATWDARDDRGSPVASGVYFCRFAVNGFMATKKMMLLH